MILLGIKINTAKKLLLTGGRGFTGQYLIPLAKLAGYEVHNLIADINDQEDLEREVLDSAPNFVIHCAGISFVPSQDEEAFYRVHALGSSNLLKSLAKLPTKPTKILLASSATVYGNAKIIPTPESHQLVPIDHYAMSKVAMEEMAKNFFDQLPIIIARPFNYTGPGQRGNFLIPKLVSHFTKRSLSISLGNLNVEREFNDVLTICDAYLSLLKYGETGEIYNVGTGQIHSLIEVIEILEKITCHKIHIETNEKLVRENEILCMRSDPSKLMNLMSKNSASLTIPDISETLTKMLNTTFESK
jgi:nucleoside-diphosphate-sugar epimerase